MSQGPDHHIRQRAYEIWEEEGRPEGREAEHWRRAEEEFARPPAESLPPIEEDASSEESLPPVESLVPKEPADALPQPSDAIVDQDFSPPPPVTKARAPRKRKGSQQ